MIIENGIFIGKGLVDGVPENGLTTDSPELQALVTDDGQQITTD